MGHLVAVYNALNNAGSTTVAISIAESLALWANKKTLLINCTHNPMMECYLSEIKIKYNLDYIKILEGSLNDNNIGMIVTPANNKLDVIGCFGSSFSEYQLFYNFICIALQKYDYVVMDLSNNIINYKLLEKSDVLIPVWRLHKFNITELQNSGILHDEGFTKNTLFALNQLPKNTKKEADNICKALHIEQYFPICLDDTIYKSTCINGLFHKCMTDLISTQKGAYINDILDLVYEILIMCGHSFKEDIKPSFFVGIKKIFGGGK